MGAGVALIIGGLALTNALGFGLAFLAVNRSLMWRRRHAELLAKPFAFWEARERNRRMWEALRGKVTFDSFARTAAMPEDDPGKVVKFRRPQPFADSKL